MEETTENNEPEVQVSMEGIQEKISKGIRDVFGGKTQEEKEEFPEESMDMVNEAGITREDEIPEEIIKSDASQKEPENVPELEAEPEKPGAEPMAAIKMPELNIPESMKNMELSKPPKVEEVAETKLNIDSIKRSSSSSSVRGWASSVPSVSSSGFRSVFPIGPWRNSSSALRTLSHRPRLLPLLPHPLLHHVSIPRKG